jgi:hypothetical protein
MKSAPPLIATWLLERVSVDDSLTGDLFEEFVAGKGRLWYWKQTAVAVLVSLLREILAHKWLAIRAIATGWVVWITLQYVIQPRVESGMNQLAIAIVPYAGWIANGWIIGRFHRPYQTSMVLAYVLFALLMSRPPVYTFLYQTLGHPSYTTTPTGVILALASLIVGGLLSATREPRMSGRS